MKRFFTRNKLWLSFLFGILLFHPEESFAQRRPPRPGRYQTPWLAGAEIKVRPLNKVKKSNPSTPDTVEIQLVFYRDCESNPGSSYSPPNPIDSLIGCFYSVSLCEYRTYALWYSPDLSDRDATPLCPYNPAKTKCDTSATANPGYRTEVYADTVVLYGTANDWVIGFQYSTEDARSNYYTRKYNGKGEECSITQITGNRPAPYLAQAAAGTNPPGPFQCRMNGFNTASQANDPTESYFYIEATYSNKIPDGSYLDPYTQKPVPMYKPNTTPNSAANPFIFQCLNLARTYDLGYYDVEGHTLEFEKATPLKAACFGDPSCGQADRTLSKLTFANGCSESNPLCGSSTYNLDPNTGIIDLEAKGGVGKYKTAIKIKEKDDLGNYIGEVLRDITITIINPPNCNTANSISNSSYFLPSLTRDFVNCAEAPNRDKVIEACAGTNIKFTVVAKSESNLAGAAINITGELHHTIAKTGGFISSVYVPNTFPVFDTAFGTLHWNIPDTVEPGIYPVIFQIRDCIDGYILSRTVVYKIRVNKKVEINWSYLGFNPVTTAGVLSLDKRSKYSYNCGSGIPLVYVASGEEPGSLYDWHLYDAAGNDIDGSTFNYFSPSPLVTGSNYMVTLATNQYCNNRDTGYIIDKPGISPVLTFTAKDSCFGTIGTLEVTGLGSAALTSLYDWQGINSEFATTPSMLSNTASPILTKPNNKYNVYVITKDMCIHLLSTQIELQGIKPRVEYTTDKQYVCPIVDTIRAYPTVLTTSICGQSQFSVITGSQKVAEFTGTQSNTNATPKIFTATPAIDRGRTALLYRASELRAMNFKPGVVKEIAFYIDGINDPTTYNSIDIWAKCTNKMDLANGQFEDTNTMMKLGSYSSQNLNLGWNVFSIGSGFTWDGETNLIFDVTTSCNKPCNGPVPTSPAYGDHLTNYVSVIGKYGNGKQSFEQASVVTSNYRHNIRFHYYDLLENFNFSWSDANNASHDISNTLIPNTTSQSPQIVSRVPLTYQVEVENGKCKERTNVDALVDTNYKITVLPSEVYKCPGDTVQIQSTKGYLTPRPLIMKCAFSNNIADSCRAVDTLFYPIVGNRYAVAGSALHTPFGGVNATLGNPTTDKRVQMLYTFAELNANPNMRAGYIRELKFYMDTLNFKFANTNKLLNFGVRMKCAPKTQDSFLNNNFESLASFEEVYTVDEFETNFGIVTIPLAKPFAWDGNTGLIVDICFDNFTGTSYNADRVRATNTGKKRFLYSASNTTGTQPEVYGCVFETGTRDVIRPNIGFTVCRPTRTPPPIPTNVKWAPVNFISNTEITNPIIYNRFTTQYYTILNYVDTTYGQNKVVCLVRDTFMSHVDRPKISFEPAQAVACYGGSVSVSAGVTGMNQNLYSYQWDTTQFGKNKSDYLYPNQIITPPNPGYHYVTVASIDSPNCYNTDSIYVNIQLKTPMPDLGGTTLLCPGDTARFSIPRDVGYKNPKWRFNGSIIDTGYSLLVSKPGMYSMIVDSGACINTSLNKMVVIRDKQTVTLYDTLMTVCEGDSAYILYNTSDNVSNPLWNIGQTTPYIKVTQPGIYYLVNPRDQYGCLMYSRDTATVTVISNPDFTLTDDTLCLSANQKVVLQPSPFDPSATYYWEPSGRNISSLEVYSPGTYKVTRRKGNCVKIATARVENDTPGSIFLGKNRAVCCDEVFTLDANPDGKKYRGYKWSTGELSQVIYTKPNASGVYVVEATRSNGCKDTGSIFIDSKCGQVHAKPEKPEIFLGQSNNIIGEHLAVIGNVIYRWIPSDKDNFIEKDSVLSPTVKPRDTGDVEYVLVMTVIDTNYMPPKPYCIENEVVRFKVIPNKLDTVNAFSPDGDGINDYFYPRIQGVVKLKEFKVYNRYGQLLHNDPDRGWDGKYNNEPQPLGVYVALISYELNEPKKDMQTKYDRIPVTLVR